jgi:hypothetical protein
LFPDSSGLPTAFSPAFIFDAPEVWLADFKLRSLLSELFFLRFDRLLCLSSCWKLDRATKINKMKNDDAQYQL